eukprot:8737228-Alexandrium_andersonii.AAC.1
MQVVDEDPFSKIRDDDADLPVEAEHLGQGPQGPIPIRTSNTQAEIDKYVVAVGAKVNNLG